MKVIEDFERDIDTSTRIVKILSKLNKRPEIPLEFNTSDTMYVGSVIVEEVEKAMKKLKERVPERAQSDEVKYAYGKLKKRLFVRFRIPGEDSSGGGDRPSSMMARNMGLFDKEMTPEEQLQAYAYDADYYLHLLP